MLWLNSSGVRGEHDDQDDDDTGDGEHHTFSRHSVHAVRLALTKPLLRLSRAVRNRVAGRRQVYETAGLNRVTRVNVGHQLRIRENRLFAAADCDDTELLEHCIERISLQRKRKGRLSDTLPPDGLLHTHPTRDFDYEDRTELGGSAYHIALQSSSFRVAERLLEVYPEYVNMTYTGKLNRGQHPLHIAVVNQDLELVKTLVEKGATINDARCTGEFFDPSSKHCQVYWGEHPIAFAVCLFQKEIVAYLLQKGADINIRDRRNNTVLHLLILQKDHEAALDMFKYLVDVLEVGVGLEDYKNKDGLTPLKLAAKEANAEFFQELISRRRIVHWTYGPITSCAYSLKEIDTYDEEISCLELLSQNEKHKSFELLRLSPLKELLDAKWRQFGFFYFILWFVVYLLSIIILTIVVQYRPTYCPSNITAFQSTDDLLVHELEIFSLSLDGSRVGGEVTTVANNVSSCNLHCFPLKKRRIFASGEASAYRTTEDYVRLFGEVMVILGVVISLGYEIPDLYHRGCRKYFTNVGSGVFQAASWVYAFLIFLSIILRLVEDDNEEITLALAVVTGWAFCLFFARGFAFLGPYISMIQIILQSDTLRFLIIFAVGIVSFSGVFQVMFSEARPLQPSEFHSYGDTFIYLFRLAIGITEFPTTLYHASPASTFSVIFFFLYVIIGFLLLIQLLIAMMNATHQKVELHREGVWEKQLASLILLLERRLPHRFRIRTGFPGKDYGLCDDPDDRTWYIRVQEHGELKKITRQRESTYARSRRVAFRRKTNSTATVGTNTLKSKARQAAETARTNSEAAIDGLANLVAARSPVKDSVNSTSALVPQDI